MGNLASKSTVQQNVKCGEMFAMLFVYISIFALPYMYFNEVSSFQVVILRAMG